MGKNTWFKNMLESFKDDFEFRLEILILKLTENICFRMKKMNINRTQFAEKLHVSPPAVTKILNGNSNFTLKTLLSIADALELDLSIKFKEKSIYAYKQTDKIFIFPSATEHGFSRPKVPSALSSIGFVENVKNPYAHAA